MSELENKELQAQVGWMRREAPYAKMSQQDIQEENRRVLAALKILQDRLDKEIVSLNHSRVGLVRKESQADQMKVALETIKNNEQVIRVLEKDLKNIKDRREELANGLQSKLSGRKHQLERRIADLKSELRKLKLQENEVNKKLSLRDNPIEPDSVAEHARLEEQLRVFSLKYMKILEKHNRIAEQLAVAVASAANSPDLQIPQQLYDKELQERQEAQFKEYQGIVKMCTILSRRNDSESNKHSRLYAQKLKELEKTIINLGQLDRMIALREGEVLEGKKNLELIKFRAASGERSSGIADEGLSASQANLRRISYSTARLPMQTTKLPREREMSQGVILPKSLSKRQ